MEGDGQGRPSPVFLETLFGALSNLLSSNSLNSLSSASMTTNDKVTSLLSLLPPVPQNLSPSLAVFGISPIAQIESLPRTRLLLQKPGFPFGSRMRNEKWKMKNAKCRSRYLQTFFIFHFSFLISHSVLKPVDPFGQILIRSHC